MTKSARRFPVHELMLPLILFAATTLYFADALRSGTLFRYGLPSAGFMPVALSLAMYAALIAVVAGVIRRWKCSVNEVSLPDESGGIPDLQDLETDTTKPNHIATLVVMGVCLLYVLAFRPLGFVFSTFLFSIGLLAAFRFGWTRGRIGIAVNLGLAVGICALVYLFFTGIFGIQLPRWGE